MADSPPVARRALTGGVIVAVTAAILLGVHAERGAGTAWQLELDLTITEVLVQPVDVELLDGGRLVVADVGLHEVILFGPGGTPVWRSSGPAGSPLLHPGGLLVDDGQLWVADSGNARLVELSLTDGAFLGERELTIHTDAVLGESEPFHPTDLARVEERLWMVDSPGNRLRVVDLATDETRTRLTAPLDGGDPFEAPRSLLPLASGEVAVVQALGARVDVLDPDGRLTRSIGGWGISGGRFLKPKSVAASPDGGLLVLDSYTGLLQWLTLDGEFQQVGADASGVHTWRHPVAMDSDGERLAVVDAGSTEVALYTLRRGAGPPPGIPVDMDPLRGLVSFDGDMSGNCYQCHDGTARLASARWNRGAANHPLEVDHPGMVDAGVDLDSRGNLGCISCHRFHEDESYTDPTVYDVLGEQTTREELPLGGTEFCYVCHRDHRDIWVEHDLRRNHPVDVSLLAEASPEALLAAGGHISPPPENLVGCDTCHRIHGSTEEHLLVLEPTSATLCWECHQDIGAGPGRHPLERQSDGDVVGRVRGYGGQRGPAGQVACMSCHDPHLSATARLLRVPNADGGLCVACHPDKESVQRGAHRDAARLAASANAGPCGGCHSVHTPSSLPVAGSARADELSRHCLGCHDPAARGTATKVHTRGPHMFRTPADHVATDLPFYGGRIGCSTCHDGHAGAAALLRKKEEGGQICLACHPGRSTVIGTDHDAAVVTPDGPGGKLTCTSCHSNHDPRDDFLFARAGRTGLNPADGRCMACHAGDVPGAPTKVEHFTHDRNLLLTVAGLPATFEDEVPIFDEQGRRTHTQGTGTITCLTCHDPHRWQHDSTAVPGAPSDGRATNSFLRDPKQVRRFCASCHGKEALTRYNFFHRDTYREAR